MDDEKIIELFFARNEEAVSACEEKYGTYCRNIAKNILQSEEDAEECFSSACFAVWNSIPPVRPNHLSAYIAKIARNIAINRYNRDRAKKRFAGVEAVLDEIGEFIPDADSSAPISDVIALKSAINGFVSSLPTKTRVIFVRRYWYLSSIKEIALDYGYTENNVKVMLLRTRKAFKEYLEREGIVL